MGNKFFLGCFCVLTLSLTSCGDRKEQEAKLARGCEAAVKVMLEKDQYDRQIDQVKAQKFGMSEGFTLVTLDVLTKNKEYGYEEDESFFCKFQEESSMVGYIWKGVLVQVKIGEDVYGSEGGQLYGDMNDQMNLMAAVEAAMK